MITLPDKLMGEDSIKRLKGKLDKYLLKKRFAGLQGKSKGHENQLAGFFRKVTWNYWTELAVQSDYIIPFQEVMYRVFT